MFERLAGYFKYAKKNENQTSGLFRVRDDDDLLSSTLSLLTHMTELKLDARRVARIIQDADSGDPREQAELFATLQEKEPIIGAHLQTRRLAVMGCPLHIDSKKHPKEAEDIQGMLQKAGVRKAVSAMLDAIGTGYAGVAVDWAPGGAKVNGFSPISPNAFVFDAAGNPALYSITGSPKPLADDPPGQILYIELVFKRFKSISHLGALPKYTDSSARAWLYGKMLVALIIEKLCAQLGAFFPWRHAIGETDGKELVDRIQILAAQSGQMADALFWDECTDGEMENDL